ncbi:type II toxin-antitoxin system VapC family toxin [bacterium]|nr:type II toxin-antitoxin system VapC family toxin [bacterium]
MNSHSKTNPVVLYWDSSAVLSVLFADMNSGQALQWIGAKGTHLLSTLAIAEVYAVINRLKREGLLADILIRAAVETFEKSPYRSLFEQPDRSIMKSLAAQWSVRGADLWHLALAKTIQEQLPELVFITFDTKLSHAAAGEGLLFRSR